MAAPGKQREQDVPALLERAYRAAASGLVVELESALSALRQADEGEAFLVQDRLRSIARCVLQHPASGRATKRAAS